MSLYGFAALKIQLFSQSVSQGGAAKAAYRLYCALKQRGEQVEFNVAVRDAGGDLIRGGQSYIERGLALLKPVLAQYFMRAQKTSNKILHSPAIFPTRVSRKISGDNVEVVHLHWVCREMMSIEDIGRISKPVVWTMHDSWAFCGAEHHPNGSHDSRYKVGYTKGNAEAGFRGIDINRWVWLRKQRAWQGKPFTIVAPSKWQSELAKDSVLFRECLTETIPNPLPLDIFKPLPKSFARSALNLPEAAHIVVFGAVDGSANPIKGYDLLVRALAVLAGDPNVDLFCVTVGETRDTAAIQRFPMHYLGKINDEVTMSLIYNAADVVVVPSRVESFGQVASEATACGTPVAAFGATGLLDVVEHEVTGYLAAPFDVEDLAKGILWCLERSGSQVMVDACRARAEALWSYSTVAAQYMEIYEKCAIGHILRTQG